MITTIEEIRKEIADLKTLLLYYHCEPNRKIQIDEIVKNIEKKIEESFVEL